MEQNQPIQNSGQVAGGVTPDSSELSGGTNQDSVGGNKPSKTRIITILVIIAIIAGFIYAANSGPKTDKTTDDQLNTNTEDAVNQPADNTNDGSTVGQPGVNSNNTNKPTTTVDNKPQPITPSVKVDCVVMGCNNEVCTTPDDPIFTACVVQPQFVCYKTAVCEKQATGRCGWTQTPELTACLAEKSI